MLPCRVWLPVSPQHSPEVLRSPDAQGQQPVSPGVQSSFSSTGNILLIGLTLLSSQPPPSELAPCGLKTHSLCFQGRKGLAGWGCHQPYGWLSAQRCSVSWLVPKKAVLLCFVLFCFVVNDPDFHNMKKSIWKNRKEKIHLEIRKACYFGVL